MLLHTNLIYSCHILLFLLSGGHFSRFIFIFGIVYKRYIHLLRYEREMLAFIWFFLCSTKKNGDNECYSFFFVSLLVFHCNLNGKFFSSYNLQELCHDVYEHKTMCTQSENSTKWLKFLAISRVNCRVEMNFMDMGRNE